MDLQSGPAAKAAPLNGWRWAYYAAPVAFCFYLHWLGLKTWFTQDDFAWLSLRLHVHNFDDLMRALFAPMAQGTVRTLSERAYFLVFYSVFGLDALPFRIWAFLTQFASIVLLMNITRRITGSNLAGFLAPVFWCAHGAMAMAMHWNSAYNEILCGFFILSAFYFLLRHIESGARRDLAGLWVCFLLGFGALEHMVVFPVLAALYSLCMARSYFRKTLLLWLPSIAFVFLHFAVIDRTPDPQYRLYFDSSMFSTFGTYWMALMGAFRPGDDMKNAHGHGVPLFIGLTLCLVGFAIWRLVKKDLRGVFFLGWTVALLAPVLPLKSHVYDYYLTVPITGVAMLGAWACSRAAERKTTAAVAVLVAGAYLHMSMSDVHGGLEWFYQRAHGMKILVLGVEAAHKAHPERAIFLAGVTSTVFWAGLNDHPFERLLGLHRVYLTPGSENQIHPEPSREQISIYIAPASAANRALESGQAAVYALSATALVNVTSTYLSVLGTQAPAGGPTLVDAGNPLFSASLGPGWYKLDNGFRWMAKSAIVKIAGPSSEGEVLELSGFFPESVSANGPISMTVSADSVELGKGTVSQPGEHFTLRFPLPPELVGRPEIQLSVSLDHTTRVPGDERDFGLVFGQFEIKPAAAAH